MKSSFHSLIPFLPSLLNHSTAISRESLNSNSSYLRFSLCSLGAAPTENTASSVVACWFIAADMFTSPLRSSERGADDRKHRTSIFARVRFRGNVFTEPLPSNELFRLSGVMSQYSIQVQISCIRKRGDNERTVFWRPFFYDQCTQFSKTTACFVRVIEEKVKCAV
jgi:hypothetical protein